jgi:transcriptional regulator with XRE-family HTH domain
MGRGSREIPARLGEKLTQIRSYLGVSQDGLVREFGLAEKLTRNEISKYERGVREPALAVLLKYARAAAVNVEVLMDDDMELPRAFGHKITRRKQSSKWKKSTKR